MREIERIQRVMNRILAEDPAELVWPFVVFGLIFAGAWLIRRLFLKGLRTWTARQASRAGLEFREALAGPTLVWAGILAAHVAIQGSALPARYTSIAAEVLYALWMISLTFVLVKMAGNLVRHFGEQIPGALPVTTLSQSLAQIGMLILLAVVAMDHYNYSIKAILTALGIGGLAVALALQDTLTNLFAGFYIAVARQIRLGDYIKLNTGEEGYVTDIGWRSTLIRALANNLVIVPNAKLAQAIVTNYYLPEKRMSASLQVGASYQADPDAVEKILQEIATAGSKDIPGMLSDPAPNVMFDPGFGDLGMVFSVNFHVAEFTNQFGVRNELKRRILRRFRKAGIEIPYTPRPLRTDVPTPPPISNG